MAKSRCVSEMSSTALIAKMSYLISANPAVYTDNSGQGAEEYSMIFNELERRELNEGIRSGRVIIV